MLPISYGIGVFTVTPSLMMSVVIALAIDYSLFLFSRYMEELRLGVVSGGRVDIAVLLSLLLFCGRESVPECFHGWGVS